MHIKSVRLCAFYPKTHIRNTLKNKSTKSQSAAESLSFSCAVPPLSKLAVTARPSVRPSLPVLPLLPASLPALQTQPASQLTTLSSSVRINTYSYNSHMISSTQANQQTHCTELPLFGFFSTLYWHYTIFRPECIFNIKGYCCFFSYSSSNRVFLSIGISCFFFFLRRQAYRKAAPTPTNTCGLHRLWVYL